MKIILTIFAIAFAAAAFWLRDVDAPPAYVSIDGLPIAHGGVVTVPAASSASTPDEPRPAAIAQHGSTEGDDLLRAASDRLQRYNSVAALVRLQTRLFGSELIGAGLYQQAGQGSQRRYRLELKAQVGDKICEHLQVCDAETLWTYRNKPAGSQLERLDLRRVRAAQHEAAKLPPASPVEELATGGLPKLLAGLRSSFRPIQTEAGHLNDVPMWAIELEWTPSVLAALVGDQADTASATAIDFSELPQMPERVMVYLGHEDLFPRRIEFRRRATSSAQQGRAGQGGAGDFVPTVTVEFTNVRFNETVDPRQFDYGAAGAIDVTDAFLESRGLPLVR